MKISKQLQLPDSGYNKEPFKKETIVLHHTVGGTAASTLHWWKSDDRKIGTAFIIDADADGTIYQVFDPTFWASHLGLKGQPTIFEKMSIGIELASVGPLMKSDGKFYCFERLTPQTEYKGPVFDCGAGKRWRGCHDAIG